MSEVSLHIDGVHKMASAEKRDKHTDKDALKKKQNRSTAPGVSYWKVNQPPQLHGSWGLLGNMINAHNNKRESTLILKLCSTSLFERLWEAVFQLKIKSISNVTGVKYFLKWWLSYWEHLLVYIIFFALLHCWSIHGIHTKLQFQDAAQHKTQPCMCYYQILI